jgi:hypothetical protein
MRSLLGFGWPLRGRDSASAAFDRIILPSPSRTRVPSVSSVVNSPSRRRVSFAIFAPLRENLPHRTRAAEPESHPCPSVSSVVNSPSADESPLRPRLLRGKLGARISPTEPEQQNPSPSLVAAMPRCDLRGFSFFLVERYSAGMSEYERLYTVSVPCMMPV